VTLTTVLVLVTLAVLDVVVHRVPARAYLPTCLAASAGLLVWANALGLTWSDLGLGRGTWVSGILWGLGACLPIVIVVGSAAAIPRTRGVLADDRGARSSGARLLFETSVRLPWGTVLLEEVAFRGLLFVVVLESSGRVWAVVVSSLSFGLWHVVPSLGRGREVAAATAALGSRAEVGFVVGSVLATAAAGAALALLRLLSGSLLAPMLVHWTLNAGGILGSVAAARAARRPLGRSRRPEEG
jgi:membrane protease YdiL (CAAX protease family)